jgi:hypothetical protein
LISFTAADGNTAVADDEYGGLRFIAFGLEGVINCNSFQITIAEPKEK